MEEMPPKNNWATHYILEMIPHISDSVKIKHVAHCKSLHDIWPLVTWSLHVTWSMHVSFDLGPTNSGPRPVQIRGTKIYPCPYCPKVLSKNSGYHRHIRDVHLKLKPFRCGICGMHFARTRNRDSHMRTIHKQSWCSRVYMVFNFFGKTRLGFW